MTAPPAPADTGPLAVALNFVNAVLVTAFTSATDTVATGPMTRLARHCAAAGVPVITVLGNTGEVFALEDEERRTAVEAVVAGSGEAAVLVGVAGSLAAVQRQMAQAAASGAAAVMLHEPLDPLASSAGLTRFLMTAAESAPLPVVLYVRSGRLTTEDLRALARHPQVLAVKYAVQSLAGLAELLAEPGTRDACVWVNGAAEGAIPAARALGIRGFTSGLANIRPDLALTIRAAFDDPDPRTLYRALLPVQPFEALRARGGGAVNVAAVKAALRLAGIECGHVRPPCRELTSAELDELGAIVAAWPAGRAQDGAVPGAA